MLTLETQLPLATILSSPNLAEEISERDCSAIAAWAAAGLQEDLNSRVEWETRMTGAMKIALQVKEAKTWPWPNASNVKFPLLTIAAIQYHSRAYPSLVQFPEVVRCRAVGEDSKGEKWAAADRISAHMNYQLQEEDEAWEEDTDRLLLVQPILGSAFKKTYFSRELRHNVSELVLPSELVVNYWTRSLDESPRITHLQEWSYNKLQEKIRRGLVCDVAGTPRSNVDNPGPLATLRNQAQGTQEPSADDTKPFPIAEQHCWLDMDGDGYKEPYVVTFRQDSRQLLRIVARFFESKVERTEKGIVRIEPERFFTKFPFIPSPDGGFYDLGFGALLGPLNESIDTAINQLLDAGTMHNAGGGFIGKGARVKGGEVKIEPGQWHRLDSTGDDLRKSIFPAPTREPSPVLFQLLGLLVQYGQQVGGSTDALLGENPGQNTKAETMQTMVEQGLKTFTGIYKRTYRAFRDEFRKCFRLNQLMLDESSWFSDPGTGEERQILLQDYQLPATFIRPAADPTYVSDTQRLKQAMAMREAASTMYLYKQYEVEKFFLAAMKVPGVERFLWNPEDPNAPKPPQPLPIQIEQIKLQPKMEDIKARTLLAMAELEEEGRLNDAKIAELEAKAVLEVEEAGGIKDGHRVAMIEAQIGAAKLHREHLVKSLETLVKIVEVGNGDKGGSAGVAGAPGNGSVKRAATAAADVIAGRLGGTPVH